MIDKEWRTNDLVVLYYRNQKYEKITDVGIIESFTNFGEEIFADIRLLHSKYSKINTLIHAPRNEVYIIGNIII